MKTGNHSNRNPWSIEIELAAIRDCVAGIRKADDRHTIQENRQDHPYLSRTDLVFYQRPAPGIFQGEKLAQGYRGAAGQYRA